MAEVTAKQIMLDAIALKEKKSQDYQGGKWTEADYFPFGDHSYMHMIHTKYLRMRNIMDKDCINFEGLEDTLIDMINYCAMYAAWIENQKMKEAEIDKNIQWNSEDDHFEAWEAMSNAIKESKGQITISTVAEGAKVLEETDPRLREIQVNKT